MKILNNLKLSLASRLVGSVTVNVRKHPEFVRPLREDGTGEFSQRNYDVAEALLAIDKLKDNSNK